ncbi:MAG: DNA-processing protein DprA [Castellaniella sp.]
MPILLEHTELRAWIRLTLEPALGAGRIHRLLSVFSLPHNIYTASTSSLARYLDPGLVARLRKAPTADVLQTIEDTIRWLDHPQHHLLTLADPLYPATLLQLEDSPPVLYAHGQLPVLTRPMLAIVGARSATPEGERNAHDFAEYLARHGWCVVSGLAAGIDGAAHRGALAAGPGKGGTLAILGTGIDRVYPASHRALAHEIAEQGLMLSEFPLGTQGLKYHFPRRNRLVAALGQGVLVVEAATRSGSLITARLAGELGREVFAIPGSIHSPLSKGCHTLIRQGAKLVESGQDILEELSQIFLSGIPAAGSSRADTPASTSQTSEQIGALGTSMDTSSLPAADTAPDPDTEVLLRALGYEPKNIDALQTHTQWPLDHLIGQLTLLEVRGLLSRLPDGRYQRR